MANPNRFPLFDSALWWNCLAFWSSFSQVNMVVNKEFSNNVVLSSYFIYVVLDWRSASAFWVDLFPRYYKFPGWIRRDATELRFLSLSCQSYLFLGNCRQITHTNRDFVRKQSKCSGYTVFIKLPGSFWTHIVSFWKKRLVRQIAVDWVCYSIQKHFWNALVWVIFDKRCFLGHMQIN